VNVLVIDEIVSEFFKPLEVNENVGSEAAYTFEALVVVAVTVKAAALTVTVAAFVPVEPTVSVALTVIE
jgi:hypothetical protein